MAITDVTPAVAYDIPVGATIIKQIISTDVDPGQPIESIELSGVPDPVAFFVQEESGQFTLVSSDLAGVLALISLTAGYDHTDSGNPIKFPLVKRASGSTYQSGMVHDVITFERAMMVVDSIEAAQGQAGTINVRGMAYNPAGWDSSTGQSNYYVTPNQSVAATSFNASHTLGPVTIDGVQAVGVTRTRVNVGVELTMVKCDGLPQPKFVAIKKRNPTIDVEFESIAAVAEFLKASAASTIVCGFRSRKQGSTVDLDATAKHITVSFGTSLTKLERVSGQRNENIQPSVRLFGSNLAFSVNTTL